VGAWPHDPTNANKEHATTIPLLGTAGPGYQVVERVCRCRTASFAAGRRADAVAGPLPPNGQITDLTHWWQQFNDPLLTQWITAAQNESPTQATAAARLAQSRASRVAAGAALQAGWELDLFGGGRAARDAAQARLVGAPASWHAARVALAAEVARDYLALRACDAQALQTHADATSRVESARLTDLSAFAVSQALGKRTFDYGLLIQLGNRAARLSYKPVDEVGNQISGFCLTWNDCDITRSRNPDVRQWRHQPSAGNIDIQHRQRADPDAKPVFHSLAHHEKVIKYLTGASHKMLESCCLKPVRPLAGASFARKQRMALDVGWLQDRPMRE